MTIKQALGTQEKEKDIIVLSAIVDENPITNDSIRVDRVRSSNIISNILFIIEEFQPR